jgi:predicted dehydrogenase
MVQAPEIDAIWIVGPNDRRVEHAQEIYGLHAAGKADLRGVACEKPLARNVGEAKTMLELAAKSESRTATSRTRYSRPPSFGAARSRGAAALRSRAAVPRSHRRGALGPAQPVVLGRPPQGGGVLNDMLCHSVEAGRYLLCDPTQPRESLRLRSVNAQIACLKWRRPEYSKLLAGRMPGIDYTKAPAEGLRAGEPDVRGRRREPSHPRSEHVLELRRSRPAADVRAPRAGVCDGDPFARHRPQGLLQPGSSRRGR